MGRRVLRRRTWGYPVCLCPIKGTLGLYELSHARTDPSLPGYQPLLWGF